VAAPGLNARPYISVVVSARNDDQGGDMLRRMRAFVGAWVGQCKQYDLPTEIIIVEWHPPSERATLIEALDLPSELAPCQLRFIEVPAKRHACFDGCKTIPLLRILAKNAGIRRARGEFVLATNPDIICSAELMQFLAGRRLETGKMYRIDRHDVRSDVPSHATPEDLLAFCRRNMLRIFTAEGSAALAQDGLRSLEKPDIVSPAAGIRFGRGWYDSQTYDGQRLRWIAPEAEIIFRRPAGNFRLALDVETGPSAAGESVTVEIVDSAGRLLASDQVEGRSKLQLTFPEEITSGMFRLRTKGADVPITSDARMLNLCVFGLRWEQVPPELTRSSKYDASVRLSFRESRLIQIEVKQGTPMLESVEIGVNDPSGTLTWRKEQNVGQPFEVEMGEPNQPVRMKLGFNLENFAGSRTIDEAPQEAWILEVLRGGKDTDWASLFGTSNSPVTYLSEPKYLHTNTADDFTLLSRDDWFALRGYPEFEIGPAHVDALFCYAAYHGGIQEVVLREPMRIFHIEHLSDAGWTPERETERNRRIESKGVAHMPCSDFSRWIDLMRQYGAPFIFCRGTWGLGDVELHETVLPSGS
jgi:hypothetical protein